jgi:putative phosphoesterase
VLGNHDFAASNDADCKSSARFHEASVVTRSRITLNLMPKKSLDILGKAEKRLNLTYDGLKVKVLHAAPGDELYRYMSKEEASKLSKSDIKADLLVVGHTHIPYEIKRSNDVWVVNPGSVGMPKDGDARASYAMLDTVKREVNFERAEYDVELMLSELKKLIGDDAKTFELLARTFSTGQ